MKLSKQSTTPSTEGQHDDSVDGREKPPSHFLSIDPKIFDKVLSMLLRSLAPPVFDFKVS
jgi:hypothetical protein